MADSKNTDDRGDDDAEAMGPEKLLQDDEDDEFLDGSHNDDNKHIAAGQHSDSHHLALPDGDDPLSDPTSTLAAPAGGVAPAAAAPPPAISKEMLQVEVELRLLEALEIYHPAKLQGIHRHFILYGLMEYLERRLNHHFSSEEILELLDRFYNLDVLKPDEEEAELLSQEEDFSLPASILSVKEEFREN